MIEDPLKDLNDALANISSESDSKIEEILNSKEGPEDSDFSVDKKKQEQIHNLENMIASSENEVRNAERILLNAKKDKRRKSLKMLIASASANLEKYKYELDLLTADPVSEISEVQLKRVKIKKMDKKSLKATSVDSGEEFDGEISNQSIKIGDSIHLVNSRLKNTSSVKGILRCRDGSFVVETKTSYYRLIMDNNTEETIIPDDVAPTNDKKAAKEEPAPDDDFEPEKIDNPYESFNLAELIIEYKKLKNERAEIANSGIGEFTEADEKIGLVADVLIKQNGYSNKDFISLDEIAEEERRKNSPIAKKKAVAAKQQNSNNSEADKGITEQNEEKNKSVGDIEINHGEFPLGQTEEQTERDGGFEFNLGSDRGIKNRIIDSSFDWSKYDSKKEFSKAVFAGQISRSLLGSAASVFAVKAFIDVPRYLWDRRRVKSEKTDFNALFNDFLEKLKSRDDGSSLEIRENNFLGRKLDEIEERIDNFNGTEDEKNKLYERFNFILEEYNKKRNEIVDTKEKRIKALLDISIQNKVSGMKAIREALNTTLVATGAFGVRGLSYGVLDAVERYKKLKTEAVYKGEDAEFSFKKDVVLGAIIETINEFSIVFNKKKSGWQKGLDFAKASGNILRYIGIVKMDTENLKDVFDDILKMFKDDETFAGIVGENFSANVDRINNSLRSWLNINADEKQEAFPNEFSVTEDVDKPNEPVKDLQEQHIGQENVVEFDGKEAWDKLSTSELHENKHKEIFPSLQASNLDDKRILISALISEGVNKDVANLVGIDGSVSPEERELLNSELSDSAKIKILEDGISPVESSGLKYAKSEILHGAGSANPEKLSSLRNALISNIEKTGDIQKSLATIYKGEGIEHALIRQLQADKGLAESLLWNDGKGDLNEWAKGEAHRIAMRAGYIDGATGKSFVVKGVDEASYVLKYENGQLAVEEYIKDSDGFYVDTGEVRKLAEIPAQNPSDERSSSNDIAEKNNIGAVSVVGSDNIVDSDSDVHFDKVASSTPEQVLQEKIILQRNLFVNMSMEDKIARLRGLDDSLLELGKEGVANSENVNVQGDKIAELKGIKMELENVFKEYFDMRLQSKGFNSETIDKVYGLVKYELSDDKMNFIADFVSASNNKEAIIDNLKDIFEITDKIEGYSYEDVANANLFPLPEGLNEFKVDYAKLSMNDNNLTAEALKNMFGIDTIDMSKRTVGYGGSLVIKNAEIGGISTAFNIIIDKNHTPYKIGFDTPGPGGAGTEGIWRSIRAATPLTDENIKILKADLIKKLKKEE